MSSLSAEERFELITRDLEEVVGGEQIKQLLLDGKDPKLYWGTATTGKPHLGYFVPIFKIADFLLAGCHVTILFADLHAFLDNLKSTWEQLNFRCDWYELVIKQMLTLIGVPLEKLRFVKGTDFQLTERYTLDVYKMSAVSTCASTTHAGAEVVKAAESPLMSALLYPILQALDEEHLGVDIQFGGTDQRKIFMFARQALPKVGYKKRCHLMNPLIPGLGKSGKMSSSEPNSKVDFDDSNKVIKKKIGSAYAVDGVVEGNGLLAILKHVVFKFLQRRGKTFDFKKPEKWGGDSFSFANYEDLESAFINGSVLSGDFKPALADALIELITPLREVLQKHKVMKNLAYGDPSAPAVATGKASASNILGFNILDARVGQITAVSHVEDNEKLFNCTVDVGGTHRTIVSAIAGVYTEKELVGRKCVVVCNLPGSEGMIMRAVTKDGATELIAIPEDAALGTRISACGDDSDPDLPFVSKKRADTLFKKKMSVDETGGIVCNKCPIKVNGTQLMSTLKEASIPGR